MTCLCTNIVFIYLYILISGSSGFDIISFSVGKLVSKEQNKVNHISLLVSLSDFTRPRWLQLILASLRSRSARRGRRIADQQRRPQLQLQVQQHQELVLPMLVLWHLHWKPLGRHGHVLHSGHFRLGSGLRYPRRRNARLRRFLLLWKPDLHLQTGRQCWQQQAHSEHYSNPQSNCLKVAHRQDFVAECR